MGKDEYGEYQDDLKHVETAYVTPEKCVKPFSMYDPEEVSRNTMCAASPYVDSCTGDSGKISSESHQTILALIVIFLNECHLFT